MYGVATGLLLAIAVGVSFTLPATLWERLDKRQGSSRQPSCPADNTMFFTITLGEDGTFAGMDSVTEGVCNCRYNGDEEGHVGSNMGRAWYPSKVCKNTSYAGQILNQDERRLWEISCDCETVAPGNPDCVVSYLEGQWMRCLVYIMPEEVISPEDKHCTKIKYPDGTISEGTAMCDIAAAYYWGGKK